MGGDLAYVGSVLLALAGYAVGFWLLLKAVEGVYWLYCKLTGREY